MNDSRPVRRAVRVWVVGGVAALIVAAAVILALRPSRTPPGSVLGGRVTVLGVWGGHELDSFLAMVAPFEERNAIKVQFEGTRDLNAILTTRVQGGNPPDVAVLPGPGQLAELARAGRLIPLDRVLNVDAMKAQYAQSWLDLVTVDGKVYGVFVKAAAKGLIWHDPKALAASGYAIPKTWDELMALTRRIADEGKTPWCVGLESGAASGWPATDWIEDLVLRDAGPAAYDRWYRGELSWTDPAVKAAWERFGAIVTNPKYVYGGAQGVLATNFGQSPFPMFSKPPGCYLHHQATFIQDLIQKQYPALRPGEDLDFFPFPRFAATAPAAVEIAGDVVAAFRDTPQARALLRYLSTPEAHTIWVRRGGALSPNRAVSLDAYPDTLARRAAEILTTAEVARFDASDLMPEAVSAAFWKGTLDYVREPRRLDEILRRLDQVVLERSRR